VSQGTLLELLLELLLDVYSDMVLKFSNSLHINLYNSFKVAFY